MNGAEVAIAALGIMATVVGVLVWLLKKLFTQNDTTLKEGNAANLELAKSINKLATASEEQVRLGREQATAREKWEALVVKKLDAIDKKADRNYEASINMNVKTQNVQNQVVQNEVVEAKQ
ncbi:hypothetical protein [Pseudarthrobacter sp. H2]|uniref:hypothetical protein n=1 Tax=Pseudarthrobacter sp. H2 TaxID=3418415 RepID=UPI003CE7087F